MKWREVVVWKRFKEFQEDTKIIFLGNHYVQNPFLASKCFDEKGKYYAMKFMEVQKKGIQLQFRGGYDQTFVEPLNREFIHSLFSIQLFKNDSSKSVFWRNPTSKSMYSKYSLYWQVALFTFCTDINFPHCNHSHFSFLWIGTQVLLVDWTLRRYFIDQLLV